MTILLQSITQSVFAQSLSNCQYSSKETAQPVGDSPGSWATLRYRLLKIKDESLGSLYNMESEDQGISFLYRDPNNNTKIRIELVGLTNQGIIASQCWNDRIQYVFIYVYNVSTEKRLTWKDLEDSVTSNAVFNALALFTERSVLPIRLGELEYRNQYLEKIRNNAHNINSNTIYLSFGIRDDFRLFSTEYNNGELIFWVYFRQEILKK